MTYRLATSCLALSTAFAAPALADVTAADVFSNQQALYEAAGISLGGTLSGDQLMNPELNIILPQGVATFQVKADSITMSDNGDGTVTISYPSPMNVTVAGGVKDEGSFALSATMTHDGYTVTASGNPGDITYVSQGQNLRFVFDDMTLDAPGVGVMDIIGDVNLESWTGTTQVTEGNLITYTAASEIGATAADVTVSIDGVQSQNIQTTLPLQSAMSATLPVGGSDVMNLSAALRNGLSVAVQTSGQGSTSEAITTQDGNQMNRQVTTTGAQTTEFSFNEEGLKVDGVASDFDMVMNEPMLFPGDLKFGLSQVTVNYDVPLNASEDTQDFRVATSLQGLTLDDTIWNLVDPAGMLPRDPADISFDVTGMGTNGTDLLDFMALSQMFGPPAIEVDEVTIENLRIAAVGAEIAAGGSMTFDWSDFNTIPGLPRPEGAITVNVNGANQLMDTLVAMGLLPEDQLMMPRMMMGMFATPVGDDMLQTILEVNDQGHVLANGQRLQ